MSKGKTKVTVTVKGDKTKVTVEVTKKERRKKGERLRFAHGNAKLKDVHTLSLPSGYACPGADLCLSRANRKTGKIRDGKRTHFRCFSASQEALYPNARDSRWRNYELLRKCRTVEEMVHLIMDSIPRGASKVRPHVAGDFFSQRYFDAWMEVARQMPDVLFYAYTKSIDFWVARYGTIPRNFVLTASYGGKHDSLIYEHELRHAVVVFSKEEAEELGLEIDHDDSLAQGRGPNFALLLHGPQPKGSEAARAHQKLKKRGEFGYGKRADEMRKMWGLPTLN